MIITQNCYKLAEELQKFIRKHFEFKICKLIIAECVTEVHKDDIKFTLLGEPNAPSLHNPEYRVFGFFSDAFLRRKYWALSSKVIGSIPINSVDCKWDYNDKTELWVYRIPIEPFARAANTCMAKNCLVFPTLRRPAGVRAFRSAASLIVNGNYIEVSYKDQTKVMETYLDINVIYSTKEIEEDE